MTIHHVFANRSNIGDWLSARGIQQLLPGQAVVEYLCDAPFVDETLAQLSNVDANDLVIIGGGGLFSEYFSPFWRTFLHSSPKAPFVLWGVGCCDRKLGPSLLPLELIQEASRKSRICVVRDQLTRNLIGDAMPQTLVAPCPTMIALSGMKHDGDAIMHIDHFDNIGEENFYTIKSVCDDYAVRNGVNSLWSNNLIPAGQEAMLQESLGLYRSSSLIVSSRLHGCIIGLAMGCHVLAISGDRKVESFMQAAGLAEWVCDIGDLAALPGMLERLHQQPSAASFIASVCAENEQVAHKVLALVANRQNPA